MIKFLLLAIASKTIVELKAITTEASLKNFSPVLSTTKLQFFGKIFRFKLDNICNIIWYNKYKFFKMVNNILFKKKKNKNYNDD